MQSVEIGSAVYEMDWTMLSTDVTKYLLMIITRCKKPITITSGHIVSLSNESFMKVNETIYVIVILGDVENICCNFNIQLFCFLHVVLFLLFFRSSEFLIRHTVF